MAVYLIMIKEYEDNDKVVYRYGPSKQITGKIGYNKVKPEILDIEPIAVESTKSDYFFQKAAQKLAVEASGNNGDFSNEIIIAS